jgi:hypothetical protein
VQPSSHESEIPERLGRYRLVRCISSGGMARVYEARRESLAGVSPKVAIKVILPEHAADETFQQLFVNEARIGSQLQHQNLVQIQDFDRAGKVFFLVMEFVEGLTLRKAASLCRRHGVPIPLAVIAEMGRQVCEGLHAAHTACNEEGADLELVHRDIKPSNLILSPQGVVKVLDFGISKALVAAEHAGTVKGTWGYMSPEQAAADDQVWHAADQYGLAAVLYELAMLQPLYPEREPSDLVNLMHADEGARRAARLSGPHSGLGPLLMRALQRDPHARYPNCASMATDLAGLIVERVSARDQLLRFYATVLALDRSEGAAVERSASTFSRAGVSKGTMDPYSAGLPVAVGNERHPHQVAIDVRPPAKPQRHWSTGALAWMGVGILVVAFVSIKLFWPDEEVETVPAVRSSMLSPGPEPVEPSTTELEFVPPIAPQVPEAAPPQAVIPEVGTPAAKLVKAEPGPMVTPAAPKVVRAPAQPKGAPGLLTVSSLPKAKVSVDGKRVGQTPLYQYSLNAGSHKVVLTAEDGRTKSFSLNVSAGEESRRIWHFEREEWVER